MKVMVIAGFFHGVHDSDRHSATNCYFYLIKLGVDPEIAGKMAEYVANEDSTDKYFKLIVNDDKVSWEEVPSTSEKDIYQKIFQSVDCEDMQLIGEKSTASLKTFPSSDVIQSMGDYFLESGSKDNDGDYCFAREKYIKTNEQIQPDAELSTAEIVYTDLIRS